MGDVRRPDWWCYPIACQNRHPWGPGRVLVSWTVCGCASGDGRLRVHCAEPGCRSIWYKPPHQPGAELARQYPPPVAGQLEGSPSWPCCLHAVLNRAANPMPFWIA